jgi:hypothetical protein
MYPSWELQEEVVSDWSQFLKRFPWQWHATLTFPPGYHYHSALRRFRRWKMRLIDEEKIQFGACLISSTKKAFLHFHVLALGRNRSGKTLFDCSPRKWGACWPFHSRIEVIESIEAVTYYVASHFYGWRSDHAGHEVFNTGLLRRVRRTMNDGLDGMLFNCSEKHITP